MRRLHCVSYGVFFEAGVCPLLLCYVSVAKEFIPSQESDGDGGH